MELMIFSEMFKKEAENVVNLTKGRADIINFWQNLDRNFLFEIFRNNSYNDLLMIFSNLVDKELSGRKIVTNNNLSTEVEISGQFLKFTPSFTTFDGIAEKLTYGLFDGCEVPAPEFWVGFYNETLISFIPEKYIEVSNVAIASSLGQALEWVR
ncbi:hypothetical protein [Acinetobacter bereziniae]|uniref:hypothetical protein n=1 Tax=Acinetobacter bereziniae TaxID=106648 RepID=UPI00125FB304|nr:hypothetical protein [Acinetobacter bereziniae]